MSLIQLNPHNNLSSEKYSEEYKEALELVANNASKGGWQTSIRPSRLIEWFIFKDPEINLPNQGWKLHVTASAVDALSLVKSILPELLKFEIAFKLPATLQSLLLLNSGFAGKTQIGKILTIYPKSDEVLKTLANYIDSIWHPFKAPKVVSDLSVGFSGSLFIRYGAFSSERVLVDCLGRPQTLIVNADGIAVSDERSSNGLQPSWVSFPPLEIKSEQPASINTNDLMEPITIEDQKFLLLKTIQASVRGRVCLGLRMTDLQLSIIKIVNPGIGTDIFGRDSVSRLENEYYSLSKVHELKLCPKVFGYDADTKILTMEDLAGNSLEEIPVGERLAALTDVAEVVNRLHEIGFVHRDLKLSNILKNQDDVRLIDFELAAKIETANPMGFGTSGHIPPEGVSAIAKPSYDIFSFGSCLFHSIVDFHPARLPTTNTRGRQIAFLKLLRMSKTTNLVRSLMSLNPEQRPSAAQAAHLIRDSVSQLFQESKVDIGSLSSDVDKNWLKRAAVEAGFATRSYLVDSEHGHYWRNAHLYADFASESINIGAAGIIIGLSSIDTALHSNFFDKDISGGAEWLASRNSNDAQGFFTGSAGISVALAIAGERLKCYDFREAAQKRFQHSVALIKDDYDLFSGLAGVIFAGCSLSTIWEEDWPLKLAENLVTKVCQDAYTTDRGVIAWAPNPLFDSAGSAYFGTAHGSAGIAMALGTWAKSAGRMDVMQFAADVFVSLYQFAKTDDGKNIVSSTSGRVRPARYWCHGVGGYLWSLMQVFNSTDYLQKEKEWAIQAFVENTKFADNPTLCHGLAGTLEIWRNLQNVSNISQFAAKQSKTTAAALRILHQHLEGYTVWSSEEPIDITPDLWVGFLGPAVSLVMFACNRRESILSPEWLKKCAELSK